MSPSLAVGVLFFALLLLFFLPAPRWRRLVFRLLGGGLWLLLAVVVLACALFHVFPALAPPMLASLLEDLLERLTDQMPALTVVRPFVSTWSILAALAVVTGLPLLRRLDKACRRADLDARQARATRCGPPTGRPSARLLKDLLTED